MEYIKNGDLLDHQDDIVPNFKRAEEASLKVLNILDDLLKEERSSRKEKEAILESV